MFLAKYFFNYKMYNSFRSDTFLI